MSSNQRLREVVLGNNLIDAQNALNDSADVNAKDYFGNTALMWHAMLDHTEIVQKLLAVGADVNACDSAGRTALELATKNKKIIDLLKAYGAGRSWMQRHGNKLLGAGVVGVGLIFGLGYVLPAFSFSMKLTVSIASACTVLLLAYGIDHSAQAAYKAEVLAKYQSNSVPSDGIKGASSVSTHSHDNVPQTAQPGASNTEAKTPSGTNL